MQIILREEVLSLGTIGDIVEVKPGYARNYLLPRGLAVEASTRNLRALEHQKRVIADKRMREQKTASAVAERLAAQSLTFTMRAGAEGKLFGSVTNQDVQRQLAERGFALDRRRILLTESIKTLGDHAVIVHVGPDTRATLKVTVLRHAESDPVAEAPPAVRSDAASTEDAETDAGQ